MSQEQLSLPSSRRICLKEGCNTKGWKRGFCGRHYQEWYRQNYPERVAVSAEKRRESTQEYHRAYYLANREKIKTRAAARYANEDPEQKRFRQRRQWAKDKYGLTLEEYDAIIARGCAICGTHEGKLCVDHDHTTGKVRDALCHYCNMALGSMKDDPIRLRAAARYLETHRKGGNAK